MSFLKKIVNGFVFVVGGIVTITVGFFMLRGTMRMWDRNKEEKNSKYENIEES